MRIYEKVIDVLLRILDDFSTSTIEQREEFDIEKRILGMLQELMNQDARKDVKRAANVKGINQVRTFL